MGLTKKEKASVARPAVVYVARDADGTLFIYPGKRPKLTSSTGEFRPAGSYVSKINNDAFPEVASSKCRKALLSLVPPRTKSKE